MRSHQVKYVKRQVVRSSSAKDSLLSALSKMRRIERVSIAGTPLAAVDEVSRALAPLTHLSLFSANTLPLFFSPIFSHAMHGSHQVYEREQHTILALSVM